MSEAHFYIGDVFDVMGTLDDGTFDLVCTSPPFLALRSYLPADHPDKAKEIGSEPNPAAFIDTLLALTAEWGRLLAPHGSLCIELGDTYAGSGGAGGDYGPDGMRGGQEKFKGSALKDRKNKVLREDGNRLQQGTGWPLDKSLALIPELYRLALAYGINPLTGAESPAGRWRVRNVVRWHRPNPPVGALGDKYRPSTSDMVIACRSRTRYFDLDAVRTEHKADPTTYTGNGYTKGNPSGEGEDNAMPGNPAGAPPLDTWTIPTHPYKGSHYATWPPALLEKPIKSMVPERVCTTCGEPSRRVVETEPCGAQSNTAGRNGRSVADVTRNATTVGWTDCGHNTWRRGHVLDPFGGSGTTGLVATGHGRDATLIDIDHRNADLARDRIGMFLTIHEPTGAV